MLAFKKMLEQTKNKQLVFREHNVQSDMLSKNE